MACCCRRFGIKCGGCGQGILPNDLVRRARQSVYHIKCFLCSVCRKQLSTGEQLYVVNENQFLCKDDYIATKLNSGRHVCMVLYVHYLHSSRNNALSIVYNIYIYIYIHTYIVITQYNAASAYITWLRWLPRLAQWHAFTEVKQRRPRLVLGWVTVEEDRALWPCVRRCWP